MTFRILDFPDLTTEGSFPLGAVAVTLMNFGWNPILATLVCCNSRLSCWSSDWSPLYEKEKFQRYWQEFWS